MSLCCIFFEGEDADLLVSGDAQRRERQLSVESEPDALMDIDESAAHATTSQPEKKTIIEKVKGHIIMTVTKFCFFLDTLVADSTPIDELCIIARILCKISN